MSSRDPRDCACYGQYADQQLKVCMPCAEAIRNQRSSHGACAVRVH